MKVLFVPALLFLLCVNSLHSQKNSTIDAGFFTGLNFNYHTTEIVTETAEKNGLNFMYDDHWGVGFAFGSTIKANLSENWSFDLRAGYSSLYSSSDDMKRKDNFDNMKNVLLPENYRYELQVHTFILESSFSYKIFKDFFLSVGLRYIDNLETSYYCSEEIVRPYDVYFNIYQNGDVELISYKTNDFSEEDVHINQFSILYGMGYDFYINDKIIITPEMNVTIPSQDITTFQAGIALRIPVL